MNTLSKLLSILNRKDIFKATLLLLLMIIGAFIEMVGISAIYPFISVIGNPDWLTQHPFIFDIFKTFGITTQTNFVLTTAVLLLILYVAKALFIAWENRLQINFAMQGQFYFSSQLFALYMRKPYLYHTHKNSAEILRNATSVGDRVFLNILVPLLVILTEIITGIFIISMLFTMDWLMALLTIVVIVPVVLLIYMLFRKRILRQGKIQTESNTKTNKWVQQGLGSIKETKVLQKEYFFADQFRTAYYDTAKATADNRFINTLPQIFLEMTAICGLLAIVIIKVFCGADLATIVPTASVLAIAVVRLMPCANRILNNANIIKFNSPFFNEIYSELNSIKNDGDEFKFLKQNSELEKMKFEHAITVEHLHFKYPESDKEVINDISFEIPKGSFVGIIGPSGAGKTTLVDLLLGLLLPANGQILVDGKCISENAAAWLRNISYVPQSIFLIDGTIAENVALGYSKNAIEKERLEQALKDAELYDFVSSLPKTYDTEIGERGVRLSGGQKQRIGIARALYNNPEVLILDEATSALDSETEKNIIDSILKLKGKITIISIAHRLSTLDACDFKIKMGK